MKNIFTRKRLLSEKKSNRKVIGYARALNGETDYLNQQICRLNNFGCHSIFSEVISLNEVERPQLKNAFEALSKGDIFIIDKFDRAFNSKKECIRTLNKLLNNGIQVKTLTNSSYSVDNYELISLIFIILGELDNLEQDILREKKREMVINRKIIGENLGGRPKISHLKESLVLRLRNEGYSYRTIRSQTGVALSTIRRIIIESEAKN